MVGVGCFALLGTAGCGAGQDHILAAAPAANNPAVAQPRLASVGPVADTSRKVSVDNYATAVCTGLAQFGVDFHAAKARRATAMTGSAAATSRTALLGYYDALDAAFDRIVASTRSAGVPNLSDGKTVAAGVVATLDAARQAGDRYRPKAQALAGSDTKGVRTAALKLADSSDREVAGVMGRLSRYDGDPMFRNAFTRAITCQHR
jgi:hypothetical protein